MFLNHPLLALYINFAKSKIISKINKINKILLFYVLVNIWQHRWKNVNSGTQDKKHCSMRMRILESVTEKSHRTRIKSVNVSQKHTQSFSQISLPFFRFNFCFALKCHPMSHLRVLNVPQKCHILFERPLVSCVWHYLLIFIQNPMKFVEEEEEVRDEGEERQKVQQTFWKIIAVNLMLEMKKRRLFLRWCENLT